MSHVHFKTIDPTNAAAYAKVKEDLPPDAGSLKESNVVCVFRVKRTWGYAIWKNGNAQ